jgi:hypothetical protein
MKNVIKIIGAAVLTGLVFAVIAACAGPSTTHVIDWTSPADDTTWTTTAVLPAPADVPSIDLGGIARDAYLETVRAMSPRFSDAQWLDFAGVACAALDQNGQDMMAAAYQTSESRDELTDDLAAGVVGAAMGSFYCEHYYTTGS